MKQKLVLIVFLTILVQAKGFAQRYDPKSKVHGSIPMVVEDGIWSITVSDNIDIVLIPDAPDYVRVKASDKVISRLRVSYSEGRLFLEDAKNSKDDDRLIVYVWVSNLESLTLKGNSFAISQGILESSDLHVSLANESAISIKSRGKVWFDEPLNHQLIKENGYVVLSSL